ncbi:putative receptor protein kinase ZmPK1 [Tasmannia lanceolata]|uniref:putative receptor protein kinase ZmPK1 n=1 Tax=Tasmannia lanceolata TaxID=3420 RepID=UPI004063EEDC
MRNPTPASSIVPSLILSFFLSPLYFVLSSLNRGSSLLVEESQVLISSDRSFTCGFYSVGINAYCFSIWFTNSSNRTIIWTANRDRPVNGQNSRISLLRDGNMVLTDVDGSTIWNTKTSGTNVERLEILNSGNLVIKDPQENILWQSFDYPTDTFLPSQPITKGKSLISAKERGVLSSGYYHFNFDSDNVLKLMYDGPVISSLYWPDPDNNESGNGRTKYNSSRYGVLDEMGRFQSSDKLEFNASDMGFGIKRRLTLDYDGNLRLYSLNESSGLWGISWAALAEQCKVHGQCGRNGICVYTPTPKCSCPPGYERKDPSDWTQGCVPKFNQTCNTQLLNFIKLPQTDFYGFDLNYTDQISFETCRKICLEDCSCEAFGYRLTGTGVCYPKTALFNGYRSPNFPGSTYIKMPKNVETSDYAIFQVSGLICKSSQAEVMVDYSNMFNSRPTYVHLYWFASAAGLIEILFIASGWWYLFRKHEMPILVEEGYRAISNQFRRFTYTELKKATKKFKEELGRGGSGAVYKGILADNRVVAVKKLGDVIQGEEEFWAEVSTIGKINHMNLVRMWGYCSESLHRLLVYEYVENGSLDKYLFIDGNSINGPASLLGWNQRFKIAIGAAKGLAYLHHECLEWVIHCDVKPENILLDGDFEAKIADFGLAKLSQRGGSGANFSRIRGTKGYMAPEWALNLPISAMVDVYSYGVVVLEIVKGSRFSNLLVDGDEEVELRRFARMAKEKLMSGEESWLDGFVDFRLNGQFNRKQALRIVEIGIACVEDERNKRPNMEMIVQTLLACEEEGLLFGEIQNTTSPYSDSIEHEPNQETAFLKSEFHSP